MYAYQIAGLSVRSEIALPGMIATRADGGAPDVTMREGIVPHRLANAGPSDSLWEVAGDRCLLTVPGVSRFLLIAGREITFQTENGVRASDVAIYLSGSVFGALLHQRGNIVLHASAVQVDGKAALFCGPSGAGKSTIAAALAHRGYPLVTDDISGISFSATPTVQPDGRCLKLLSDAIDRLGLAARRRSSVNGSAKKWFVDPNRASTDAVPVGVVYLLREAASQGTTRIERLAPVDAVASLAQNAYRPQLVRQIDQRGHYFKAAAAIAHTAGIFTITRPLDFASMPEVIDQLEQHWSETAFIVRAA